MRLLILSPHFPPSNAADHQRVRMYLPHLLALGWDITVLAVDPQDVAAPLDPWLAAGVPAAVKVIRVRAPATLLGRLLRRRSLGWRALPALRHAGGQLLREQRFDVLYVSTTQFTVARLALQWRRSFDLPYVFDLQDPWLSDHHSLRPLEAPPGGHLRYALAQRSARFWEPRVLKAASAMTVVAPDYAVQLRLRYPELAQKALLHLPFGVEPQDFVRMQDSAAQQTFFDPADGLEHWVYVGRGGADMARSWSGLFDALALWRSADAQAAGRIRVHLIGTSYASADTAQPSIAPLAKDSGVDDLVYEHPQRVPYLTALRCLRDAHALLLPASSDLAYQPSKLHLAVLAHKPMLLLVNRDGPMRSQVAQLPGACVVTLDPDDEPNPDALARRILDAWLKPADVRQRTVQGDAWIAPHTAANAAARLDTLLRSVTPAAAPQN